MLKIVILNVNFSVVNFYFNIALVKILIHSLNKFDKLVLGQALEHTLVW